MIAQPPPNPKHYITDNDDAGNSFFNKDVPESVPITAALGRAMSRLGYTTDRLPVVLTNETDLQSYEYWI